MNATRYASLFFAVLGASVGMGCAESEAQRGLEDPSDLCSEALLHAASCASAEFDASTCTPAVAEAVLASDCTELDVAGKTDGTAPRLVLGPDRASWNEAFDDARRHVEADPGNVSEKGEYCGMILRTPGIGYKAIRHGANSSGACGTSGIEISEFIRGEEQIDSTWHSHPPNSSGGNLIPPSAGDAAATMTRAGWHAPDIYGDFEELVIMNDDTRIVYRLTIPQASVGQGAQSAWQTLNDDYETFDKIFYQLAWSFTGSGQSYHSALLLAGRHFAQSSTGRSTSVTPGNWPAWVDGIATGIAYDVSYDGGITFQP